MTSRYPTSSLAAFAFLEDLLSRLRSIFPSHTVHTGTKIQIMSPIIGIFYLGNFDDKYYFYEMYVYFILFFYIL